MYVRSLFHSSQKPTRKLAATTFTQSQCLKALAPSLRVGFCDKWKSRISGKFRTKMYVLVYTFVLSIYTIYTHLIKYMVHRHIYSTVELSNYLYVIILACISCHVCIIHSY